MLFAPIEKVFAIGENTIEDFGSFLGQQNIISLAVATAIGLYINSFITDIMNVVGIPIINRVLGKKDEFAKKYEFHIFGVKLELGKIMEIILKLLVMLIIVYLIFSKLPSFVSGFTAPAPKQSK